MRHRVPETLISKFGRFLFSSENGHVCIQTTGNDKCSSDKFIMFVYDVIMTSQVHKIELFRVYLAEIPQNV